ncbi:MAG: DUF4097 family beta strand repeat-containing protein [Bacteroidota bacterium]|nr:DUF4097 family beta strand repeat-containing protein [Bacteroidota bacterium]
MKLSSTIVICTILAGFTSQLVAQSTVSQDIHIMRGEQSQRKVTTISGDVSIGSDAEVKASITTVSGDIEIGAKAKVENISSVSGDISIGKKARTRDLESVSGDIHLYPRSIVHGSIEVVSGDITCETGTDIRESVSTVSGDIELDDTRLREHLETVSGDISLFNGAIIEGDIIISRRANLSSVNRGRLKVIIDMNSVVKGNIRVEEPNTNVIVYLTNGGKVKGKIINAEIRK